MGLLLDSSIILIGVVKQSIHNELFFCNRLIKLSNGSVVFAVPIYYYVS